MSSFRIESQTGRLTHIGEVALESDPCYMSTDRGGRFVFSAYYEAGRAAVHPIRADGVACGPPIEWLATARGAHCMQADPSNRFVFVPHIAGNGPNAIYQFKFDARIGGLTAQLPRSGEPGTPRRPTPFLFSPQQDRWSTFRMSRDVASPPMRLTRRKDLLSPQQTVSTLPRGTRSQ